MSMAIIMQCHKNSEQINKIIDFFNDKKIDIYIHVDKKSMIKKYINKAENVKILEDSINVKWAQYSQVEATIALMTAVKESGKAYKYIHFISGQDYPIKSLNYIKDFFKNSKKQYIEYFELPNNDLVTSGYDRYQVYYPQCIIDRTACLYKRILRVVYREFVLKTKFLKRNISYMPKFYGGSCWFSITGECAEYVVEFIKANIKFNDFFKHSIYADEMFLQTIVLNSKYKEDVINCNLRYIDWTDGKESPKSLGETDIDYAIKSKSIFARKIEDIHLMKYIDKKILK